MRHVNILTVVVLFIEVIVIVDGGVLNWFGINNGDDNIENKIGSISKHNKPISKQKIKEDESDVRKDYDQNKQKMENELKNHMEEDKLKIQRNGNDQHEKEEAALGDNNRDEEEDPEIKDESDEDEEDSEEDEDDDDDFYDYLEDEL